MIGLPRNDPSWSPLRWVIGASVAFAVVAGIAGSAWLSGSTGPVAGAPSRGSVRVSSAAEHRREVEAPATARRPSTMASATPAPDEDFPDEAALTRRLRELAEAAPERTLELARAGNERFPEGPDAAERNWYLTRALVNLKRFPEAQAHAREMVERYPGTHWASDVERHLLVHPLGLPSREEQAVRDRDAAR